MESPSLRERIAAQAAQQGVDEAKVYRQFLDRQPMGRIGSAEEIAQLALYLGSEVSAYTTGAVHVIDGGMSI
ncbi:2-keto-3-deoxy-L-fuconate dehydrogenase [compost metagenome]